MTRKTTLISLLVSFVFVSQFLGAYPSKETLNFSQVIWGWNESSGVSAPVAVSATSGAVLVEGSFSVGTVSVSLGSPPNANETTTVTVTSATQLISALASRNDVTFIYPTENGTGTVWINPGGATATVGIGIPLYPGGFWSRDADSTVPMSIVSTWTVNVTLHQGGY